MCQSSRIHVDGEVLCRKIRVFRLIAVLEYGPELAIVPSIGKPTSPNMDNVEIRSATLSCKQRCARARIWHCTTLEARVRAPGADVREVTCSALLLTLLHRS